MIIYCSLHIFVPSLSKWFECLACWSRLVLFGFLEFVMSTKGRWAQDLIDSSTVGSDLKVVSCRPIVYFYFYFGGGEEIMDSTCSPLNSWLCVSFTLGYQQLACIACLGFATPWKSRLIVGLIHIFPLWLEYPHPSFLGRLIHET